MTLSAGQRSQLQADLTEARTLLKLMSRQSSERLERVAAEKEAELSTAHSRLADTHRYCHVLISGMSITFQETKRLGQGACLIKIV